MITPADEFITQAIVLYHKGCGGGEAWVQWGVDAIAEYQRSRPDLPPERLTALWEYSYGNWPKLLKDRGQAAEAMLRCGMTYGLRYVDQYCRNPAKDFPQGIDARVNGECVNWVRTLAESLETIYSQKPVLLETLTAVSRERGIPFPERLDLGDETCLVDAAAALLGLQRQVHEGVWPKVLLSQLDLSTARRAIDLMLALLPDGKPSHAEADFAKDVASKATRYDSPCAAMDGLEFELSRLGISHTPAVSSPMLQTVRDRMIREVEAAMAEPPRNPAARDRLKTAARVLLDIGDPIAIECMIGWLTDYPYRTCGLFDEYQFDARCYEIDRRGRRRDLVIGDPVHFVDAPLPESPARRDPIEVMRPIGGKCGECGGRMVALFDILHDPAVYTRIPAARRVFLPLCVKCVREKGRFASKLRFDDRDPAVGDVDMWSPLAEPDCPDFRNLRRYRPVAASSERAAYGSWAFGKPNWEQDARWPRCKFCKRAMLFMGQATVGPTCYGFFCDSCKTSCVIAQYD